MAQMGQSEKIDIGEILDNLPLGPKNQRFWDERAKRIEWRTTRKEAERLRQEKAAARVWPEFVQVILAQRLRLGLTQKELARRLKTNQAVISKLERGQGNNTISFLTRVCAELNLEIKITIT